MTDAEGNVAHRLDARAAKLERFAQSSDVDAPDNVRRICWLRRQALHVQALHVQAGYAFLAASRKVGLTRSAGVSGLIPVISRNQTFSPRAHAAASSVPS